MNDVPLTEMHTDLENTKADIARLVAICKNLESFIQNSGGEDRSFLKMNLLKYRGLLASADTLAGVIRSRIEDAETNRPESET